MAGVGGDFAPSVTGQHLVDDRGGNGFFQVLGERGADGGNDDHSACGGLLEPRLKKGFFLGGTHELATTAAPVARRRGGGFAELRAEGLLHAWDSGATHAKDGCGLLQRDSKERRKQNGLAETEAACALGVAGDFLGFVDECRVDGGFSCHPDWIAKYVSS